MALGTPSAQMLTKLPDSIASVKRTAGASSAGAMQTPVFNASAPGGARPAPPTTIAQPMTGSGTTGPGQHTTGWTYGTGQSTTITPNEMVGYNGGGPITDIEDFRNWANGTGPYAGGGLAAYRKQLVEQQQAAWRYNQSMQDYFAAQARAAQLGFSGQAEDYRLQSRQAGGQYDLTMDDLNSNADIQRRLLELSRQRDVDQAWEYNQKQRGFTDQAYNTAIDYLGKQRGFASEGRSIMDQYLDRQQQLAQRVYDTSIARAGFNRDTQREQALSAATAGGAVLSGATTRPWANTGIEYGLASRDADNSLYGSNSLITKGRADNDLGYRRSIADIDRGVSDATLTRDRARADQDKTDQYIQSLAKTYGVRAEEIENGLRIASKKAGMDYNDMVARLEQLAANSDARGVAAAAAVLAQGAAVTPAGDGTVGPQSGTGSGSGGSNLITRVRGAQ